MSKRISFSSFAPAKPAGEELPEFVKAADLAATGQTFEIYAIRKRGETKVTIHKTGKRKKIGAQVIFDILVMNAEKTDVDAKTLSLSENPYRLALYDALREAPRGSKVGPVKLVKTDKDYYAFEEVNDPAWDEVDSDDDEEEEEEETGSDEAEPETPAIKPARKGR